MIGQKVICIDAGNTQLCRDYGMKPLIEGETYTVRAEVVQPRGAGYLLEEIQNDFNVSHNGKWLPGVEPSYSVKRFIETSTIDETEMITNENVLCQ